MIVAKMGTIGETAKNGPNVEETAFGKDPSILRISLAAGTVAKCLVHRSLLVLRSRKWFRRRQCHRDFLAGLGQIKRRKKGHGVEPECGSRGAIRASRIVLCLWSL